MKDTIRQRHRDIKGKTVKQALKDRDGIEKNGNDDPSTKFVKVSFL